MDLRKIGKYIAEKRQKNNFTQESLAEKLDISNRAVSKWERGICLPDSDNMAKLCELFKISYNELLSGEDLKQADYEKRAEEKFKEFAKIETAGNKKLLMYEILIGAMSSVFLFVLVLAAGLIEELPVLARVIFIVIGFIFFVIGVVVCLKIETEAGKYECKKCGHLYVPKYSTVCFAMHFGRTRYMTCPKCGKKSWQRKKI